MRDGRDRDDARVIGVAEHLEQQVGMRTQVEMRAGWRTMRRRAGAPGRVRFAAGGSDQHDGRDPYRLSH